MMFKQGNFEFKFDDVPNLGINDKLSIKNTDTQVYTNTSKHLRDDFYNLNVNYYIMMEWVLIVFINY